MADVKIVREFKVTAERLFRAVTEQAEILNWWGHDGMTIPTYALDFTCEGPWHSEMIGENGGRYKLSGQVTHVNPPRSVGFTWAWHDEADRRGPESHVTLTVEDTGDGAARLTVDHRDLQNDDVAARHEAGWISGPILRLERHIDVITG